MKFKGDILITDPGYLVEEKDYDTPRPKLSDYSDNNEGYRWEEYIKDQEKWDKENDTWEITNNGEDLSVWGFTNYISEDTLYGDWSQIIYEGTGLENVLEVEKKCKSSDNYAELDNLMKGFKELGTFCADSGMVCVVNLEEAKKFNPKIEDWCKSHPWCASIIRNFEGDIEYTLGEDRAHIIGKGNINFFTA